MARGTDAGSGWRRRGHEDTVVAFPEAITGQAQSFASDASCSWQSVVRSPVSSVPAAAVDFASVLPGSSELLTSPHAPPPSSATMVKLAKVRGPARADTGGEACCLRGARAPRRGGGPARNPGSVRGRHAGGKSRATSGRSRGVWPLDLMVRRAEAGSGRRLWGAPGVAACVCRAREGGGLRSAAPSVEKAPGPPVGDGTKLVRPALAGPRLLAHVLRCAARHVGFGAPRVSRLSGSGCSGTLVRGSGGLT